ncbi:hypothetical protein B0H66DRAFT_342478 [Apodospora peruviana]|uniref:Uncharacterized protein n=1 Tax=Apodospora peruviana TaxID=516989 RepID=A0AAE0HYS0_9PEZI|nr:hypothetical protein B0H66DRAFT_342478 [Apodospora peruviana]
MASNFSADEIWGFLQNHRSGTPADAESSSDWYSQSSYPRRAPPVSYDPAEDEGLADTFDLVSISDSNYTTASRTPTVSSRRTAKSAASSSVFSRRYAPSTSTVRSSVVPPRAAPHPSFAQQFNNVPAEEPAPETHGDFMLWCELSELKGCNASFRGDDVNAWIYHHAHHLRDRFPGKLMCWFCDDVPFVADNPADRWANFCLRMEHIRGHIFDEGLTPNHMRPDFHIIKHLGGHNELEEEVYTSAMAYDELPPGLRLPGETCRPLGQPHYQAPAEDRDNGQYIDLEREERRRRRREKDSRRNKRHN